MSQHYYGPTRSFASTAALNRFRRVALTAGVLAYAGATTAGLGTLEVATTTVDQVGSVRLWNAEGTRQMVADGAISANADVFAAADGKITASGSVKIGVAMQAASIDGDIIEVLPAVATPPIPAEVAAAGSAQGDAAALTAGALNSVSAADGTKGVVLPDAAAGKTCRVYNEHGSNGLKIYPATGDDINDGTTDAAITIEGKTLATFEAIDDTTWAASFTANT